MLPFHGNGDLSEALEGGRLAGVTILSRKGPSHLTKFYGTSRAARSYGNNAFASYRGPFITARLLPGHVGV